MNTPLLAAGAALALSLASCDRDSPVSVDDASEIEMSQLENIRYEIAHLQSLGGTASSGNGISNTRYVVGSSNLPGNGSAHAALWSGGSVTDLGTLGGSNSNIAWPGVSNNGRMIVGISETAEPGGEAWACRFFFPGSAGNQCLGFVYENGLMTALPTWPGGINGFATGVNSRGQVVGWAENGVEDPTCNAPVVHQFRATLWEPGTGGMRELPPLPGDSTSAATAINNRGQVVGISGRCANAVGGFSAQHAVLWNRDGTVTDIGNIGGDAWHTPMDINERGEIVGFGNPSGVPGDAFGIHAFYRSMHGDVDDLGTLEGDATSQALGINNRGQVVGVSSGPDGNRAFFWDGGDLIDLNSAAAPGYEGTLLVAGHINDAGVITGVARDPETGDEVAFVATPRGRVSVN